MNSYRYVVFPYGKQPTVDEAAEFRNYSDVVAGKSAVGVCRKTSGLAIAFDADAFDVGLRTNQGFAQLIEKWQVRGGVVVDRLSFAKDKAALKPVTPAHWVPEEPTSIDRSTSYGTAIANKEWAAQEAMAKSLFRVQQTMHRYELLKRFAKWAPYLLVAFAALVTIVVGSYTRNRLLESEVEKRRETVIRVIDDPMNQGLNRVTTESESD